MLKLVAGFGLPLTRMVGLSRGLVWKTPVGPRLALENLSPDTGSIKDRAAQLLRYRVEALPVGTRCVIASSGNHGIAYVEACGEVEVSLTVVVPRNTAVLAVSKLVYYGAAVIRHGETWEESYDHAKRLVRDAGSHLLDVDAPDPVAVLGTVAHEMLTQRPDTDAIVLSGAGACHADSAALASAPVATSVSTTGRRRDGSAVESGYCDSWAAMGTEGYLGRPPGSVGAW